MFYVSSMDKNSYGVTDTTDGVEEFYTERQIYDLIYKLRIKILGVSKDCIKVQNLSSQQLSVVNILEPLENKIRKASFLSHPNNKDTLDIYKSICEYIKIKYKDAYSDEEIRYQYAKDGYSWFELVIDKNGSLIISEGSVGNNIPFGWFPSEVNAFETTNKWVCDSKSHYKGIHKLIKSWNNTQKYLDSLID